MRREFSKSTKAEAYERCKDAHGVTRCDECTAPLMSGRIHYDHRIPCALGGEPVLSNCQVLCKGCHTFKTSTEDVPRIAEAKREHLKHIGADTKPKYRWPTRTFSNRRTA